MNTSIHRTVAAIVLAAVAFWRLVPCAFGIVAAGDSPAASISWTRLSGNITYNNGNPHILESAFPTGANSQVDTVIVASDSNLALAAASCGLAGVRRAPVIVTDSTSLTADAAYELVQYAPENVLMVGFGDEASRKAVKTSIANTLRDIGPLVNANLYGATAAEASYKLFNAYGPGNSLNDYFSNSTTAVIASSAQVGEIVSSAPYAYAVGAPIFLTDDGKSLSANTVKALADKRFETVVIAGSEDDVSSAVEKAIANAGFTGEIRRWESGDDAAPNVYESSSAIARAAVETGEVSYDKLAIAGAGDYAHAVSGASACGENGSVLLLGGDEQGAWDATVERLVKPNASAIETGYLLGTRKYLSADFEERIRRIGSESTPKDLHFATATFPRDSFEYSSGSIKPIPDIVDAGGTPVPASCYLVTYYDNETDAPCTPDKPGSYTATVNGISGGYTNSRSATFAIKEMPASTDGTPKQQDVITGGSVTYKVGSSGTAKVTNVKTSAAGPVTIPASIQGHAVTEIAAGAFKGCKKLTKVTLKPTKLKAIGSKAFYGCKKLKLLTVKSKRITKVGANAFKGVTSACKVKVPASRVSSYAKLFRSKGLPAKASVMKE